MADDKDKKDGEAAESGKKGGLGPLVFVAIGAVLGGAGTVVLSPGGETHHVAHEPKEYLVAHPDPVKLQFHPRPETAGGPTRLAVCTYKFEYRTSAYDPVGHAEEAGSASGHGAPGGGGGGDDGPKLSAAEKKFLEGMKLHWTPMKDAVLALLSSYTEAELIDLGRRDEIKRRLRDLMTRVLFPDGEAVVERIYIVELLIQK